MHIINSILKFHYFPQCWKIAKIITLPKPGKDPKFPQNYRPISLLNTLAKVTESVILKRLNQITTQKGLIQNEQFGFRSKHSTTHQLVRLVEYITDKFNKNQGTGAVFLDIEKAFDRVWITGLLYKLIKYEIPACYIHLLNSYLRNRKFCVSVGNELSSNRNIEAGVPQGSLLGPTLFSLYINDIPKTNQTSLALFADDTCIFARSWQPRMATRYIQNHLNQLEPWFAKWKIKINVTKCEAINFTKRKRNPDTNLTLFNRDIQWSRSVKYLGIILDSKLTFATHIKTQIGKATGRLNEIKSLLNTNEINLSTKVTLYKSLVRPILTYASAAWGHAAKTHTHRLQIFQNRVIKTITNCPRYTRLKPLHETLRISLIMNHIKLLAKKFYNTTADTDNVLVKEIGNYTLQAYKKHRTPLHLLQTT